MSRFIPLVLLTVALNACSSTTGYHGPPQFSGWAIATLDSEQYSSNYATSIGPLIQTSFAIRGNDYFFQIRLNDSEIAKSPPASFLIDSVAGNFANLEPNEPYNVSYVADSGSVLLTSSVYDTLAGSFVLRLHGSDSSVHYFSGVFAAGSPAVP